VEIDAAALQMETYAATLELETVASRIRDFCGFSIIGGNCSRIEDRISWSGFGDGGRRASRDIEAGEVDTEATAARSITIEVRLH
jgi:hypothetical protein